VPLAAVPGSLAHISNGRMKSLFKVFQPRRNMVEKNFKFIDPFGQVLGEAAPMDENASLIKIFTQLCQQNSLPAPGEILDVSGIFRVETGKYAIYDPHQGVFDTRKTPANLRIEPPATLTYYRIPPVGLTPSTIPLANGQSLADATRLVIVEWKSGLYPILLPAKIDPSQPGATSILAQAIFHQVSEQGGRSTLAFDWKTNRLGCQNSRTGRSIDLYNPTQSSVESLQNGDCLKLFESSPETSMGNLADEIRLFPEENEQINILSEENLTDEPQEENILDMINIQSNQSLAVKDCTLELVQGDITKQRVDAMVNSARTTLDGGSGVDGEIHKAAGRSLVKASQVLAPIKEGQAVITPGFDLPSPWVIHTAGPVYQGGKNGEAKSLAEAYENSLKMCIFSGFTSVSFPSISTGIYGYPLVEAARIALETTLKVLKEQSVLKLVRFVLFTSADLEGYVETLQKLA
jgi:O-acetyl-ADP-ribose deacetylase